MSTGGALYRSVSMRCEQLSVSLSHLISSAPGEKAAGHSEAHDVEEAEGRCREEPGS